jgi:DNA invertase Pin-like site-specific DNA recombinase
MTIMVRTRNRAFSYRRFSTKEQAHGDSLRRQEDAAARYCQSNGLVLDTELQLLDPGRSAYRGKHLDPQKGALGKFVSLAEANRLPKDAAVLLVDDVSRLTRLGWLASAQLLSQILETGLDVVFVDTGERVTKQNFSRLAGALAYLLRAETSHQESVDKGRKIGEVQHAKRQAARDSGTIATRALPSWIECVGSELVEIRGKPTRRGGKLRLIRNRAKVVKEIFEPLSGTPAARVNARSPKN